MEKYENLEKSVFSSNRHFPGKIVKNEVDIRICDVY